MERTSGNNSETTSVTEPQALTTLFGEKTTVFWPSERLRSSAARSNSRVPLQLCHGRSATPRWRPEDGESHGKKPQASPIKTLEGLQPEKKTRWRMKRYIFPFGTFSFFLEWFFLNGRCFMLVSGECKKYGGNTWKSWKGYEGQMADGRPSDFLPFLLQNLLLPLEGMCCKVPKGGLSLV